MQQAAGIDCPSYDEPIEYSASLKKKDSIKIKGITAEHLNSPFDNKSASKKSHTFGKRTDTTEFGN